LGEAQRCLNCGCYSNNVSDISPVLVALNAEIVTTNKAIKQNRQHGFDLQGKDGKIEDTKISFGGVASVPIRAFSVEEYLKGKKILNKQPTKQLK